MNRKIIFIGGIHGVGKGTICDTLSKKFDVQHFSSSELLKWSEISKKENKKVKNFEDTQARLLRGIAENIPTETISILDGHFVLLDKSGMPKVIDEQVFCRIKPIAISIVIEEISVISKRLEERDQVAYATKTLELMQEMEIVQGRQISEMLQIPFCLIEDGNLDELEVLILGEL